MGSLLSNQGSGNFSNSRALVVQQDGTYNWNIHSDDSALEPKAFMAEISDATVLSEELVQIISAEETEDVVQRQESVADESENAHQVNEEADQKNEEQKVDMTELFQP